MEISAVPGGLSQPEASVIRGDGWTLRVAEDYAQVEDRLVPAFIELEVEGNDQQPTAFGRIEVRDGLPQCVEVRFTSRPGQREVRPVDLRQFEVAALVEELAAGFAFRAAATSDGTLDVEVPYADTPAYAEALRTMMRARAGRSTRSVTPQLLERVAEIYRANIDGRPTKAVEQAFGVSSRMASEYVQRARRAGLLPPTTPGRKRA